jgi:Alcohol dehydrogenase GroES-like domain
MRALALLRLGDRPSVQEIAVPSVDDAALVRVTLAGVNPIDYILIDQLSAASKFPFVVGLDFAGIVERVEPRIMRLALATSTRRTDSARRRHMTRNPLTCWRTYTQGIRAVLMPFWTSLTVRLRSKTTSMF